MMYILNFFKSYKIYIKEANQSLDIGADGGNSEDSSYNIKEGINIIDLYNHKEYLTINSKEIINETVNTKDNIDIIDDYEVREFKRSDAD